MGLTETVYEGVKQIQLPQDRIQWWARTYGHHKKTRTFECLRTE